MECLYHYCSNEKCFAILNGKTLRLSDIQKSNDYREMSLFFPELLYAIEDIYKDKPFSFKYNNLKNEEAFLELSRDANDYWDSCFSTGVFSNFVVCFSETKDSLSQWRGYANNGKGCSIGFSKSLLENYCEKNKQVLKLVKVEYIDENEIKDRIKKAAQECIEEIKPLRSWIVDTITKKDDDADTDGLLEFNFIGMINKVFNDTLRYKSKAFQEENEWRIYFAEAISKNPKFLCGKEEEEMAKYSSFFETERFLNNKIQFRTTDDDIIPFCPISFSEFSENPVVELWMGPKNRTREMDVKLYLKQNGYLSTKPYHSRITYC